MKAENRLFRKQNGSALILVVVVTVLLAVVGVMFLMVSRASELETAAVIQSKDLDSAVDTVVARINKVLVEDLFGANPARQRMVDANTLYPDADEPWDYPSHNLAQIGALDDPWLCDLEPGLLASGLGYGWPHITDLWDRFDLAPDLHEVLLDDGSGALSWLSQIPSVSSYSQADAAGDGVADSRWVQIPGLTTSRGEPVFAAVRIIDNCAMLNLNAAHCFYQDSFVVPNPSPFETPWYSCIDDGTGTNNYNLQLSHENQSGSGRYLTEINYFPFLRGHDLNGNIFDETNAGDNWTNLMAARGLTAVGSVTGFGGPHNVPALPGFSHNIFMNIENPVAGYQFFDITDELELRNRYLLTSKTEARFERHDIANFSLDSGSTDYAVLQVPRDGSNPISLWYERIAPANFDAWDLFGDLAAGTIPYKYDRRHVCTVYSYDRMFRRGEYPLLDAEFEGLAAVLGWTPQQAQQAQRVFWPVGPVTTDIQTPFAVNAVGNNAPYNNTETRRKILHLLFAFREYFLPDDFWTLAPAEQDVEKQKAAVKAAQVVANLIDYSDDDALNTLSLGVRGAAEGPFYEDGSDIPFNYGAQANVDCTFITENIIETMIEEVSGGLLPVGSVNFGLNPDPAVGIVFGYEKQPFISEVYVQWNGGAVPPASPLTGFAIELINPYDTPIDIGGWVLKIGTAIDHTFANLTTVPAHSDTSGLGRLVIPINSTVTVPGGVIGYDITGIDLAALQTELGAESIVLLKPRTAGSAELINIDSVANADINDVIGYSDTSGGPGDNALKRGNDNWQFVQADYAVQREFDGNYTDTLGQDNDANLPGDGFQIGVADDGLGLCRWHELEVLGLYGNGPESSSDPNTTAQTVSSTLANLDPNSVPYFDLAGDSSDLLDYIATVNRPDIGTLPGRININTAPVHVIAAAIPPSLADPDAAIPGGTVTFSALQLAKAIVDYRGQFGPYEKISDLLDVWGDFNGNMVPDANEMVLLRYFSGGDLEAENVGSQSIEDDIEEEHWILSNLANKFTVRSDVFTAYILVRLGTDGPQRRMIGIFDRSGVWNKNDRPRLVALHPVPDPR